MRLRTLAFICTSVILVSAEAAAQLAPGGAAIAIHGGAGTIRWETGAPVVPGCKRCHDEGKGQRLG